MAKLFSLRSHSSESPKSLVWILVLLTKRQSYLLARILLIVFEWIYKTFRFGLISLYWKLGRNSTITSVPLVRGICLFLLESESIWIPDRALAKRLLDWIAVSKWSRIISVLNWVVAIRSCESIPLEITTTRIRKSKIGTKCIFIFLLSLSLGVRKVIATSLTKPCLLLTIPRSFEACTKKVYSSLGKVA